MIQFSTYMLVELQDKNIDKILEILIKTYVIKYQLKITAIDKILEILAKLQKSEYFWYCNWNPGQFAKWTRCKSVFG